MAGADFFFFADVDADFAGNVLLVVFFAVAFFAVAFFARVFWTPLFAVLFFTVAVFFAPDLALVDVFPATLAALAVDFVREPAVVAVLFDVFEVFRDVAADDRVVPAAAVVFLRDPEFRGPDLLDVFFATIDCLP